MGQLMLLALNQSRINCPIVAESWRKPDVIRARARITAQECIAFCVIRGAATAAPRDVRGTKLRFAPSALGKTGREGAPGTYGARSGASSLAAELRPSAGARSGRSRREALLRF